MDKFQGRVVALIIGIIVILVVFRYSARTQKKNLAGIGASIPKGLAVTPLQAILVDPLAYQDQEVLLEGTVGYFCSSGCEFTYQEGSFSIKVFADFGAKILTLLKKKRPVRVYGKVSGEEKPFLILLGLEIKER